MSKWLADETERARLERRVFFGLTCVLAVCAFLACRGSTRPPVASDCPPGSGAGTARPPGARLTGPTLPPPARTPVTGALPRVVRQIGHTDLIRGVSYSRDGRFIVSSSVDRTVKVWDVATGLLLLDSQGYGSQVDSVEILPDSRTALVGTNDGELFHLELSTGKRSLIEKHASFISLIRVSPDGRRAIIGAVGRPKLWDLARGAAIAELDIDGDVVQAAGFTPQGPLVATNRRGLLVVRNLETKKTVFRGSEVEHSRDLTITRDGSLLVIGHITPYTIEVLDTTSFRRVAELPGQRYEIQAAALSPDRRLLATSGRDGTMNVWDLQGQSLVHQFNLVKQFKSQDLTSLDFSPDGRTIAVAVGTRRVATSRVAVYDWASRTLVQQYQGAEQITTAAALAKNGSLALTAARNGDVVLWDVDGAAPANRLAASDLSSVDGAQGFSMDEIIDAEISADGNVIVAVGGAGSMLPSKRDGVLEIDSHTVVRTLDRATGESRMLRTEASGRVDDLALSADGLRVAVAYWPGRRVGDTRVDVFDIASGRILRKVYRVLETPERDIAQPITSIALSRDGRTLYCAGDSGFFKMNVDSGQTELTYSSDIGSYRLAISADERWAATAGRGLTVWNLETRAATHLVPRNEWTHVIALALSPDGSRLYTSKRGASVDVWDVARGTIDRTLTFDTGTIETLDISEDGRRLIAASRDATYRVIDLETGESMSLAAEGGEWLAYNDALYFDASRNGGDLVSIVDGLAAYRIDQLAARNNRPDRLLAGLGADRVRIAHYYARYRRRLERLGLDEARLEHGFAAAPRVEIRNVAQQGKLAVLDVSVESAADALRSVQVFVNQVPVFGTGGRPLSGNRQDVRLEVELSTGKNRIEVSATNQHGIESLRALRQVDVAIPESGRLYVIAFGVSRYRNPSFNLKFAHKDALDLVEVARSLAGSRFFEVEAHAFVDDQVTVANLAAAKQLLANAGVHDTLIVFAAGHGMYSDDAEGQYYYLTHEADPSRLRETAAPFELVEQLVADVKPRKKLLLLDTCASGDRGPADTEPAVVAAGTRGLSPRSTRALVLAAGRTAGPRPARDYLFDRDRYIYNDLLRRTGAIVLSSSRGAELSFETDVAQNGIFTEEVLRAWTTSTADTNRDGSLTDEELRRYVARAVAEATGDAQHPVVDTDNPDVDVVLPIAQAAAGVLTRPDPLAGGGPSALGASNARALVLEEPAHPMPAQCPEPVPTPHACGCRLGAASGNGGRWAAGLLVIAWASRRRVVVRRASRPAPTA